MKKFFIVCVALAVAGGLWFTQRPEGKPDQPEAPRTVAVERRDLERVIEAVGIVEPAFTLEVKSKASGEIVSMPFEEGDRVTPGDLLVELMPIDEERNVRGQKARLELARAQLAKAENAVRQAELRQTVAKARSENQLARARVEESIASTELARQARLLKKDLASQRQVDDARRAAKVASASLEAARIDRQALDLGDLDVEAQREEVLVRRAGLEQELISLEVAELRLAETKILSPMRGLVLKKSVERGQIIASGISNVSGGTSLLTLADVDELFLEAQVDESDIGGIRPGLAVELTAEAFGEDLFHGEVQRVAPLGEDVQNVTIFRVRIRLGPDAVARLLPGMNATARVILERRPGALTIPIEAVRRRKKKVGLKVAGAAGEKAQWVSVELGLREGKVIEVRGDLEEGAEVLLPSAEGEGGGGRRRSGMRTMRRMKRFGGGGKK